jgi:hypothetical protein
MNPKVSHARFGRTLCNKCDRTGAYYTRLGVARSAVIQLVYVT